MELLFFFQAEDGIRDVAVTGVQTCALPIFGGSTVAVVPNQGRVFFHLKPRAERPDVEQVIQEFRPKLAKVLGMRVFMQNIPTIRIGGTLSKALYQYTLQDTDLQELYHWVPIVEEKMRALPGLLDVNSDLMIRSPQVVVN